MGVALNMPQGVMLFNVINACNVIKRAYTGWGVVQHCAGFGPDLAHVILALVLVVWCVVTVL